MEAIFTLVGLVIIGVWLLRLGRGAVAVGRATYDWARNLGKDTIQILEDADPTGEQTGRLKMCVCFVRLALLVSAVDGELSEAEIRSIYDFFRQRGANDSFMTFVTRILQEAVRSLRFEETIDVINEVIPDQETKLFLCAGLLEVSAADGVIDKDELGMICTIMEKIGFSEHETKRFLREMLSDEEETDDRAKALATLGMGEDASELEIKKAYRRLAQQYHPDKVAGLGPEFSDLAHERFVEIANAYRTLLGDRGDKATGSNLNGDRPIATEVACPECGTNMFLMRDQSERLLRCRKCDNTITPASAGAASTDSRNGGDR